MQGDVTELAGAGTFGLPEQGEVACVVNLVVTCPVLGPGDAEAGNSASTPSATPATPVRLRRPGHLADEHLIGPGQRLCLLGPPGQRPYPHTASFQLGRHVAAEVAR